MRGSPADARSRSRSIPRPIPVTGRLVSDVLQALASLVMVSSRQIPPQPAWLPAWPPGVPTPPEAAEHGEPAGRPMKSCRRKNALVHLPSLMEGIPRTTPPTPRFFNAYALEYDFDPAAPPPASG